MIGMKGCGKTLQHQIIYLFFALGRPFGQSGQGNQGMMIGQLRIVEHAAVGNLNQAGVNARKDLRRDHREGFDQRLCERHIAGAQNPGVGSRIREAFFPLIEVLGRLEGRLSRQTVTLIGLLLKIGECIQRRRRLPSFAGSDGKNPSGPTRDFLRDLFRVFHCGDSSLLLLEPAAPPLALLVIKTRPHDPKRLGNEAFTRPLPVHDERKDCRLDPAHTENVIFFPAAGYSLGGCMGPRYQRGGPRAAHAHDPVGDLARLTGFPQPVVFSGRPQFGHAAVDDLRGQGLARPETQNTMLPGESGRHQNGPGDHLSLPARIGRDDHLPQRRGIQKPSDDI